MHENVRVQAIPVAAAVLVAARIGVIIFGVTPGIVAPHVVRNSEVMEKQARM